MGPRPQAPVPASAGIGLRAPHHEAVLRERPDVGFLEVHTENYFHDGGPAVRALEDARASYAVSLHGVGLALGSAEPLEREHLARVRCAVARFEPMFVSEHASWGRMDGEHFNDLLPLPFTEEAVEHLAARVRQVQDTLGRQLLLENLSTCVAFGHSTLSEVEFLAATVERSDCGLLLDINNAYVTAENLGLDAATLVDGLPRAAVREMHLAGHCRKQVGGRELLIDDHGSIVCDAVWGLYEHAVRRFGAVPTLIEWDTSLPALGVLVAEAAQADRLARRTLALAA